MYCAYQGEDDYTKISLSNLSEQIQAHRTEYYTYTISEEVRTEPVQKEVRGQTITVQEDHTYTIFTLSYVGDELVARDGGNEWRGTAFYHFLVDEAMNFDGNGELVGMVMDAEVLADFKELAEQKGVPVVPIQTTPRYTVEQTSDAFADPSFIRDNTVPEGRDGQYYDVDGIYQTFETAVSYTHLTLPTT